MASLGRSLVLRALAQPVAWILHPEQLRDGPVDAAATGSGLLQPCHGAKARSMIDKE